MKTRLTAIAVALLLLLGTGISASATGLLGGGVAVLAEETGMIKGAIRGDTVRFSATDFKQAMGLRRFEGITVTSLPDAAAGVLYFANQPISAGTTVPRASLASLSFVPKDSTVQEAAFTFTCESYAGGAEVDCTIRFAEKLNRAPTVTDVAASRTVSTYKGMRAEGTLCATDPEGDALEYLIVSYPAHGTLTVLDTAYGDFAYTPTAGYTGRDSFTFVVRDVFGNYSAAAEVAITVEAEAPLRYEDLGGLAVSLPAIALARESIMTGTLVGDGMYFAPDESLSRGEFLVMAMKAAGVTPRAGLSHTVFDDDESIPAGIRPYAAVAQEKGYIVGKLSEEGLIFDSAEEVSRGEAAVILARILNVKQPTVAQSYPDSDGLSGRVREATLALCAAGIYPRTEDGLLAADAPLSRAAAAEMLYATLLATR